MTRAEKREALKIEVNSVVEDLKTEFERLLRSSENDWNGCSVFYCSFRFQVAWFLYTSSCLESKCPPN